MAKRKKKQPQLWAARQGDGDVYLYSSKPKQNGCCGECGQKVYWEGKETGSEFCWDGFRDVTGITLTPNECVQLKVTRVETPSKA